MCCLNSSIAACRSLPPSVLGSPPTGSCKQENARLRLQLQQAGVDPDDSNASAPAHTASDSPASSSSLPSQQQSPSSHQASSASSPASPAVSEATSSSLPSQEHPRLCPMHRRCLTIHPHQHLLPGAPHSLLLDLAMPRLQGAHPVTGQSWSGSRSGRVSAS